jgi:hypothetical protein
MLPRFDIEESMELVRDAEAIYQRAVAEARHEAFVEAIEALCKSFDIELSDERREKLAAWDSEHLKGLLPEICSTRRWPAS